MASFSSSDPAERLAAVREAIDKCLNSQSYTDRSRTVQRALLRDLMEMEKKLQQEVKEASNSGRMSSVGQIIPPS